MFTMNNIRVKSPVDRLKDEDFAEKMTTAVISEDKDKPQVLLKTPAEPKLTYRRLGNSSASLASTIHTKTPPGSPAGSSKKLEMK